MKNFLSVSLLTAGLIASASGVALAQTSTSAAGTTNTTAHGQKSERMEMKRDPAKRQEHMTQRMAALKAKLKLTPEQEAAWATYAAAMQPTAPADMKRPERSEMEKLTVLERQEKMQAMRKERMQRMNTEMDQRHSATQAFYAVLTPEQKKIFDAQHARGKANKGGYR